MQHGSGAAGVNSHARLGALGAEGEQNACEIRRSQNDPSIGNDMTRARSVEG